MDDAIAPDSLRRSTPSCDRGANFRSMKCSRELLLFQEVGIRNQDYGEARATRFKSRC